MEFTVSKRGELPFHSERAEVQSEGNTVVEEEEEEEK